MLKLLFILLLICLSEAVLPTHSRFQGGSRRRADFWRYEPEEIKSLKFAVADRAPAQFFTQIVDHFDVNNHQTWHQKYYVNTTSYRAGGPMFVLIGGEGPIGPSDVSDHFILADYAQQFGAMVFAVEHRYYGDSYPVADMSTANMRFLSSKQALADLANFIKSMKSAYNIQDAKVVTFGGSYDGALSAWFREKYPDVVDYAYGTSAPVQAILNFYGYVDVVSESLGTTCANSVRLATDLIEKMLNTRDGAAKLGQQFNFCSPLRTDVPKDVAYFFTSLSDPIGEAVQYSGDNNGGNRKNPWGIPQVCSMMAESSDVVANYAKIVSTYLNHTGESCLGVSYSEFINEMKSIALGPEQAGRSWTYQTCTEFGYFQSFEGNNQPFSTRVDLKFYTDMCVDIFGIPNMLPDIAGTNNYYGSVDVPLLTTNVVLPNGSLDPWHLLGTYVATNPTVIPIYILGTSHCADLYPASPNDPATLTAARKLMDDILTLWLSK